MSEHYGEQRQLMIYEQIMQKQRQIIESLLNGVEMAVSTIHLHEHNDNALILCESDLRELSLVVGRELDELRGQTT